ncbi:transposase [Paraburkholderia sp. MM5496-R1]|uniref:Transposase n=2 Tax=Burkholderiaceae TaxID=119060 RepID=A0A1H1K1Z5_9BURK|nr:Transposase [Paraburkholderia tuberum]SDR55885.1 Transposase [Paraburkholderia tuberum]
MAALSLPVLGLLTMLLTRLLNACHHFPGFVYEGARLCETTQSIEIDVRPRKGSKPICSCCNRPARGYDSLTQRRFEFIPVWGFAVFLLYTMRRVDCRACGVKVEALPWANGKHTLTRAYMIFLAQWARKLSWKETAQSFRTSWEKVFNAVEWVVDWGLSHRELGTIRAFGVDEIQYGRGHQYLTLVYQIEAGYTRLLWVGQERTKESFAKFFAMIGKPLCEKVEFVCSDMWQPYLEMTARHCPNALNILDRFHIVARMNKAIDEVRADEARRMTRDGYEPVLKKSRWCLLKRRENLTGKQRVRLRDLLQYNLRSVRAYLLKEEFQQLWDYISPVCAGTFLDQWCTQVMRSRIEPMKKFARTVRTHRELILNYFRARKQFSSGVIEGLNNKAKVTMRKAYGFRTFRATEIALYHALGKLPEPPSTHTFY